MSGFSQIGEYTVDRALGSGGMGDVYLAYSPAGDPVAVKVIRSERLNPVDRKRFEREAEMAQTVVGTSRVARFLSADPYAQRPWMAMEYVPGQTLFGHVKESGPLPMPLVASLGALLAEGLVCVHAADLLHRDLKPQNVMLGLYGPVIIDFGLGSVLSDAESLSKNGTIVGSARCMSPEQAGGQVKVTTAADVYGLGAVLLHAATGHHPYEGESWQSIVGRVASLEHEPDLRDLPAPLLPLISRMLAHTPDKRPGLDSVIGDCRQVLEGVGLSPAQARHMLMDRTGGPAARKTAESPSPALLERIKERNLEVAEDPRLGHDLLDAPATATARRATGPSEEKADGRSAEESAQNDSSSGGSGQKAPASARVARDLRERYAVQSSL